VHLFGADPNYEQNMKAINNEYSVEGLPVKIKDRVKTAIKAFDKYTQRRPIVVVVDVAYWWAGKNLGWWRSWKKDLGTYDKFAGKLNEYKKDMAALVKLLDKEMEKSGRPYVLVGKSNHNRGFEEGTVEFNFIRAMGKAVKAVFEQHGHHFYDWRDVADQAEAKGRWVMVDKLHQGSESNDLQTRAFMKWTEAELGKKYEKLAEMEAERAKEQEQEEAEMRRERRRQKREEERAAQKAKDDAEWEAAEEERRQQAAQEAAAKEEEDKQALVKAEEEAMSTLTNIRGYLNTNIANIVGPQRAAAGALGSMDVNIPQRQPSAGQTR
jgi:chemotaxis protein histidine kinase CheA